MDHAAPDAPARSRHWLLVVVFVAGAALMAYEIVGSRLLAPNFGNSTLVWGSLISVFLCSLSVGYAVGGRLADRAPHPGALSLVLAAASLMAAATVVVSEPLQQAVIEANPGPRLNPLVASILLFGPASVLMGMVSPYAVRLRTADLRSVGRTAGSLYGLSTAGSIVGTLLASFWLVQEFGSASTVLLVALVLAGCALIAGGAARGRARTASLGAALVLVLALLALGAAGPTRDEAGMQVRSVGSEFSPVLRAGGYQPRYEPTQAGTLRASSESSYHRIRVVDYPAGDVHPTRPARVLHFDNSSQAAAALDRRDRPIVTGPPVFEYLRVVDLLPALRPDARRVLLVGLGSGAAAMRLHELRPQLDIDVVELDPEVVSVARRWFGYRDATSGNPRITTHVADGRSWLAAHPQARYDAIMVDTYFADSIPFHLTTREFLELVRGRLAPDGVASANLIGAVEGPRSELLRSMHATWSAVFADVTLYPVRTAGEELTLDRFINVELLAATRRGVLAPRGGEAALIEASVLDEQLRTMLADRYVGRVSHRGVPVLTDDLAPVDSLLQVDGI